MPEPPSPKQKVLIAEDDPISCRVLQAFLVKWGYEVIAAPNGTEALRTLEGEDSPRLAVLDWMMPGMEGPQVCRRVRECQDRPYVYILLLTARNQKTDLLMGLEAGADDYLTKPFDSQELRARLHVGRRILNLQDNLIAAREELRFSATHDALTGIPNRAVILDAVHREHSRQLREGGSFGLILVDLDHFKSINDTRGHLCGDAVLREAASRIMTSVRDYDAVGRYGGEEFLVVVPASTSATTLRVAERIRRTIEGKPVVTDGGELSVTASLGVAVSNEDRRKDPDVLLQAADEALYRAKRSGRNRSELASSQDLVNSDSQSTESAHVKP